MELKRYNSNCGEQMELVCTNEEYEMLKPILEHAGVNLCTSASTMTERTVYVRNEYRAAVNGWGNDLCKAKAAEFFERGKKR